MLRVRTAIHKALLHFFSVFAFLLPSWTSFSVFAFFASFLDFPFLVGRARQTSLWKTICPPNGLEVHAVRPIFTPKLFDLFRQKGPSLSLSLELFLGLLQPFLKLLQYLPGAASTLPRAASTALVSYTGKRLSFQKPAARTLLRIPLASAKLDTRAG